MMRVRLICLYVLISYFFGLDFLSSQDREIIKDTLETKNDSIKNDKKQLNISKKDTLSIDRRLFIGVDFSNPIIFLFNKNNKKIEFFSNIRINQRFLAAIEAGYQDGKYDKNDWKVFANGFFVAPGIDYIVNDDYIKDDIFYIGLRVGSSFYNQQIDKYPISGYYQFNFTSTAYSSKPEKKVFSSWVEPILGARAQIGESNFFVDIVLKPKFIIYSKKQDKINPLFIPGYGENIGVMNINLLWGLSYRL